MCRSPAYSEWWWWAGWPVDRSAPVFAPPPLEGVLIRGGRGGVTAVNGMPPSDEEKKACCHICLVIHYYVHRLVALPKSHIWKKYIIIKKIIKGVFSEKTGSFNRKKATCLFQSLKLEINFLQPRWQWFWMLNAELEWRCAISLGMKIYFLIECRYDINFGFKLAGAARIQHVKKKQICEKHKLPNLKDSHPQWNTLWSGR